MDRDQQKQFGLLFFILLLSRIPFLFFGYGSEEDAWAIPLVAERIGKTGVYEVFRLPGHPVQEFVYSLIWNASPVIYNLVTAILSSAGILFFMATLKKLHIRNWLFAGIGLAVTPIIYLNSCNDMDYAWALGFTLIAFYLVIRGKGLPAGIFIALAVGCRITSGAILLPFSYLLWHCTAPFERKKALLRLIATTLAGSLLLFIPVIKLYGFSFFTYYEHFPIPGFAKNFYKGTFAVWGVPGFIAIAFAIVLLLKKKAVSYPAFLNGKDITKPLVYTSLISILLFTFSFINLPLKAAFMVPVIPFVWIITSLYLEVRIYRPLVLTIFASCFFLGVNLSDPLRGSKVSNYSYRTIISGQEIAFDPLSGALTADITKRQQRTTFANEVISKSGSIHVKTYVIAGWWLADILVLQRGKENKDIVFGYYTDEATLRSYQKSGYQIFYLPGQDTYNDLRFRSTFTSKYATAFPL